MPISVTCTCGKRLKAKDEMAGKRARCPACGNSVLIPDPESEPAPYDLEPEPPRSAPSIARETDVGRPGAEERVPPTRTAVKRAKETVPQAPLRGMTFDVRRHLHWLLIFALV